MRFRYEVILWFNGFLKSIPGRIGCMLRNALLPYKCGDNVTLWDWVHIDTPSKLVIGNDVSINRGTIINAGGSVTIGNDVLIGPNVTIYSQNHNFKNCNELIRNQGYNRKKVMIGNNIWIAANVTILPGVTISDNIVIGANSVVTNSLLKPGVYAGFPATFLKSIS